MSKKLTRFQLAQFLPDEQSIRIFEQMQGDVIESIPTTLNEALAIFGSGQQERIAPLQKKIKELETLLYQRAENNSKLLNRIAALEIQVAQKQNLKPLLDRIKALEEILGV